MASRVLAISKGLVTEPGVWTRDESSLAAAFNADFSSPGLIAKRRGLSSNSITGSHGIFAVASTVTLETQLGTGGVLAHFGTPGSPPSGLGFGLRGGAFTGFTGTYASAIERRLKVTSTTDSTDVIALSSLSPDNNSGVFEVVTYSAVALNRLGVPRGMGVDRVNTTTTGATGFLANAFCCRYAAVFSIGDPSANGARLGAPGMTSVVTNSSGGSRDVTGRVLLPYAVGTASTALPSSGVWLQLYRSATQATASGEPPSELALVFQKEIDATDITNGYVSFTDATPDSLRGANLYTNLLTGEDGPGGRGFINSNEPAPGASDCVTWADSLWLAEPLDYPTLELQLIAVGGSGLVAGDTVTIDGVVYTGIAPGVPAANQFVVVATGTPSFNQRETALNLCDAVNRSASNTAVYAYYVSGVAGLPGRIFLVGRQQQSNTTTSTSRAAAFRIGTGSSGSTPSAICYSKPLQPAAHPFPNRFEIGRRDAAVLRLMPFRDSLFVFKEDGLFRVTGNDFSNFVVSEFDATFRVLCRDTVVVMDDAVFAWGVQGLARITDAGVEYISAPIRATVNGILRDVPEARIGSFAFAVANQRDGWVGFFYPVTNGDGSQFLTCGSALVWFERTRCWARWFFPNNFADASIGYAAGAANVLDGLASLGVWQAAPASGTWLHTERRAYDSTDYTDPSMVSASSPTMAATAITMTLRWTPASSRELGAVQWQRGRFDFATADGTRGGDPGTVVVAFSSDEAFGSNQSATQGVLGANSNPGVVVVPVDQTVARTHALGVALTHSTISLGCWLAAASLDFRPYSVRGVAR